MNTPNVAASVRQRLLNRSRETGEDYNLLLTRFGNERLLYRIGASPHADRFVLKGAMLFAAWTGTPHRPTRDLDLLGCGDPTPEAVTALIRAACESPIARDDGLRFDTSGIAAHEIREAQEYGGVRVAVPATLGNARVPLRVDVGFGDVVTPPARPLTYPTLLADLPPPVLAAYPPETVVAEKLQAMVELGMANTRLKDFFDVWLLLRDFALDDASIVTAIRATFAGRRTPLPASPPTALSDAFANDESKMAQWAAFVGRSGVADTVPAFGEVIAPARAAAHHVVVASRRRDVGDRRFGQADRRERPGDRHGAPRRRGVRTTSLLYSDVSHATRLLFRGFDKLISQQSITCRGGGELLAGTSCLGVLIGRIDVTGYA